MMTSSGSGAYRVGGLGPLSSSNLSPLAAPFRVDKSLQKQNSTNTSVSYPDVPMYGPYSDPASQLWNNSLSSATGSKFAETESMGINTTCSSSPTVYGYSGPQPSVTVTGVYHIGSDSAAAYDPFSYDPFPNPMSTASEGGVKSYYSPYAPPQPAKDGYLSLRVGSGHNFGLSDSSTSHLDSSGSSASDHLQGRSGDVDDKRPWGSFWTGVNGQGKWSEYAQGFGSQESNQSDLLSSKSPFVVGGINKSQPSAVVTHPFVIGSNNNNNNNNNIPDRGNKSNLKKDGCFDIFGGAYSLGSLGIDQLDIRSHIEDSGLPTSVSSSVLNESSHLLHPVVQPLTNFCSSQKANGSSSGDHFDHNDFYVFGCPSTSSTSPVSKFKLPYGQSSSCADGSFSALNPNPKVRVESNESSNIFAGHDYSRPIEPHFPLGLKRQSRVVIRRPPSSSAMPPSSSRPPSSSVMPSSSSSKIGESLHSTIGSKVVSEKGQVSPQIPRQFSSGGLDLEVDKAQATFSVEKLSGGSDVHNPAEDSPCWRGASLKRLSPFGVSEDMAPNVFAINLDEWRSPNPQISQFKSCIVDTSDCRDFFSVKAKEGNVSEMPLAPECSVKDNEERGFAIRQPLCFDLNAGDGLQSADESFVSTKECLVQNNSKTDSLSGNTLGATRISREMEIPSPIQMSAAAAASEGSGKSPPVVANNSSDEPSCTEINHASSPPGNTTSQKYFPVTSKISDTNIDVNMLLKAMTNLSEIFRTYCFNKQASVPEQYSIATKQVIANLNASMVMMAGRTSSITPSSSEENSIHKNLPDAQMVNDAAFEALAATVKLGGTAEGLFDSGFCKDDPNINGDVNISEAVKKILHENFHVEEEEMDQQKLLYKSLWLDAEASLCAMTAKARFLRVKAEMEKTHDDAKERDIPSSTNTCGDTHNTVEQANSGKDSSVSSECEKSFGIGESNHDEIPEVNKCQIPNPQVVTISSEKSEGQTQLPTLHASKQGNVGNDSDGSGSTSHDNAVEASVMARYHILKSRIETSEASFLDNKESSGGHKDPSSFYSSDFDFHGTGTSGDAVGSEILSVLARMRAINSLVDNVSLNNECDSLPGEDNYLPDRESSSPVYQMLDSGENMSDSLYKGGDSLNSQLLSNSVGVSEVGEASVMARFRIIQSRINHSYSEDKDQILVSPVNVPKEGTGELGLFGLQYSAMRNAFGPYPEFTEDEDEDINQFEVGAHKKPYSNQYSESNRLSGQILEGWYSNDCSSSDWEHVSKEDLRRPN